MTPAGSWLDGEPYITVGEASVEGANRHLRVLTSKPTWPLRPRSAAPWPAFVAAFALLSRQDGDDRGNDCNGDDDDGAGKCVDGRRGTGIHCAEHMKRKRVLATDEVVGARVLVQRKEERKDETGDESAAHERQGYVDEGPDRAGAEVARRRNRAPLDRRQADEGHHSGERQCPEKMSDCYRNPRRRKADNFQGRRQAEALDRAGHEHGGENDEEKYAARTGHRPVGERG